jgi:hypothetical protein
MAPDLFRQLMKTDAEFLLRSDAATADFKDRELLVEQLLSLFDKGELFDLDWNQRQRYPKLKGIIYMTPFAFCSKIFAGHAFFSCNP